MRKVNYTIFTHNTQGILSRKYPKYTNSHFRSWRFPGMHPKLFFAASPQKQPGQICRAVNLYLINMPYYTIAHLISGNIGLKYPLIQFGFVIHNWTCVFSLMPESLYTGSPSRKIPLTLSNALLSFSLLY